MNLKCQNHKPIGESSQKTADIITGPHQCYQTTTYFIQKFYKNHAQQTYYQKLYILIQNLSARIEM